MKITVINSKANGTLTAGEVLFHRTLEKDETLTPLVSHLMSLPIGDDFEIKVENKGHAFVFKTEPSDISLIVRKAEGIIVREKREKSVETPEAK